MGEGGEEKESNYLLKVIKMRDCCLLSFLRQILPYITPCLSFTTVNSEIDSKSEMAALMR